MLFLMPSKCWIVYGLNDYQGIRRKKIVGLSIGIKLYHDDLLWSFADMFLPFMKQLHLYRMYHAIEYDYFTATKKEKDSVIVSARYNPLVPTPTVDSEKISQFLTSCEDSFTLHKGYYSWRYLPKKKLENRFIYN